jgi:hypothetical protein
MPRRTPLAMRFLRLPLCVDFELDIKPELDKAGISSDTFEYDCNAEPSSIPSKRLEVYASVFNCKPDDLKSYTLFSHHGHGHD